MSGSRNHNSSEEIERAVIQQNLNQIKDYCEQYKIQLSHTIIKQLTLIKKTNADKFIQPIKTQLRQLKKSKPALFQNQNFFSSFPFDKKIDFDELISKIDNINPQNDRLLSLRQSIDNYRTFLEINTLLNNFADLDLYTDLDVIIDELNEKIKNNEASWLRTLRQAVENFQSLLLIMSEENETNREGIAQFYQSLTKEAPEGQESVIAKNFDKRFCHRVKHVDSLVNKLNEICNNYLSELDEMIAAEEKENGKQSERYRQAMIKRNLVADTLQKKILNSPDYYKTRNKLEYFKQVFFEPDTQKKFATSTDSASKRFLTAIKNFFTGHFTYKLKFWQSAESRFKQQVEQCFPSRTPTVKKDPTIDDRLSLLFNLFEEATDIIQGKVDLSVLPKEHFEVNNIANLNILSEFLAEHPLITQLNIADTPITIASLEHLLEKNNTVQFIFINSQQFTEQNLTYLQHQNPTMAFLNNDEQVVMTFRRI